MSHQSNTFLNKLFELSDIIESFFKNINDSIQGHIFKDMNLEGGNFSQKNIKGSEFVGCDLRHSNFDNTKAGFSRVRILLSLAVLLFSGWLSSIPLVDNATLRIMSQLEISQIKAIQSLEPFLFAFIFSVFAISYIYSKNLPKKIVITGSEINPGGSFWETYRIASRLPVAIFSFSSIFAALYTLTTFPMSAMAEPDKAIVYLVVSPFCILGFGGLIYCFRELFSYKTKFIKANLEKSSFKESVLRGSKFNKCTLKEVDFSSADLQDAVFNKSDLRFANFTGANLKGVKFKESKMAGAIGLNNALQHVEG